MAVGKVITDGGVRIVLGLGYDDATYSAITAFKAGRGTSTPDETDTDLGDKIPIANTTEAVDSCDVIAGWTASGTNSVSQNTTTYLEGTAALNLIKSDGTSANVSVSKTTTSRDFTSKGLWIYAYLSTAFYAKLVAAGTALVLRFGSDAANYYYYNKTATQLASGWNLLGPFTSDNADGTNGAPVIGACDYTFMQLTTAAAADTCTAGELIFDDIKIASADDYYLTFSAGYPTFNEATRTVIARGLIPSGVANGISLTEVGECNTDASPKLASRDVFSAVVKNSTTEIIIEWTHELV